MRTKLRFSQEQFGRLFDLSKSNINSYENGTIPQTLKFIEIMDYYDLDPSKFIHLDMEKHSVKRDNVVRDVEIEALSQMENLDLSLKGELFQTSIPVDNLSADEMREALQKQYQAKLLLIREYLKLKNENKEIQDKYIKLLESVMKDQSPS
ncbi:helix-turn-helix domain-containing protein [Ekhidna sp.]|uniref:helix-turn-helix domain-containing protein n=1 Tax=Ekhidna sp. TaxID=2608089 RepID=UPI0032ED6F24